uniref:Uncharacterized protein n=1 Tax=Pseudo-nitzschia delicatissima TaxID=44447 RepID=A0A6T9ZS73_9STRA|mmetsp:Transcript_4884/g.10127  ORF Transcript_4884/g.10127 Transcript_4884/m.10127 type:complete len:123 (+) Transcript_4884:67-435(+)
MMRNTLILLLTLVALCLTFYGAAGDTTREQVLESRNRRKEQIKNLVKDAKRKLADHDSGEKILTDEEKDQLQRNVDLFQRKVESMEEELEEWEIERLVARGVEQDKRRRERSRDSRRIDTEL